MLLTTILSSLALALAAPSPSHSPHTNPKPAAFFLAGDSTTAIQSSSGGGWGTGFLSTLKPPAHGVNKGHNGATTASFVQGGDWAEVLELVRNATGRYEVFVTVQFGHNDQKPEQNISTATFQANLEGLVGEVRRWGGTPLLLTSLTRRNFNGTVLVQDLADVVEATRRTARQTGVALIDLNAASRRYVQAIGEADAERYDLVEGDRTHLNAHGSVVFGQIVADLVVGRYRHLERWVGRNETLSRMIAQGVYA